jgi:hypothetical protein
LGLTQLASPQQPGDAAGVDLTSLNPDNFVGVTGCARCHDAPTALDIKNQHTAWVKLEEFTHWRDRDKHSLAFEQLTSDRGKRIGKLLWNDEQVTGRQECLSCHANWIKGAQKPDDITLQEGVSCESCHGPGKEYTTGPTGGPHAEKNWRLKSNPEKRALGMVNVRDPRERALQCLSCHLGNAQQGKLVTHEMYAAGHPPLPGIEIETFARAMPPHWRDLNEKPNLPDVDEIRKLLNQPVGEVHSARSVLVGAVMTLRESANLAGQLTKTGPEFALFDCAMCHHELQKPSWRQARLVDRRWTPGRPQLQRWPGALVEVAIRHAERGSPADAAGLGRLRQELGTAQQKLEAVFNQSPFGLGRGPELVAASGELVRCLDQLVHRVSTASYDPAACEAILEDLCRSTQQGTHLDYHSARQVAWAIRTIYSRLSPSPGDQEAVNQVLHELTSQLRLDLPWGKAKQILDPSHQQKAFQAESNYDPNVFRQQVTRLLAALGKSEVTAR